MKYYAADNTYATETSIGFSNTWRILAFTSRADRDRYVGDATDLATRKITKRDISRYFDRSPRPFSCEAFRLIPVPDCEVFDYQVAISGDTHYARVF